MIADARALCITSISRGSVTGRLRSRPRPKLFEWLQREGDVAESEMHRVFNCGIGMVVVIAPEHEGQAVALLRKAGETVFSIGHIEARQTGQAQADVV